MTLVKLAVRTPRKWAKTVSQVLFAAGAGAIEELDSPRQLLVYAATREDAEGIAARARELLREAAPGATGIALRVEVDEMSDWQSAWTKHLGQISLTPSLVIQPSWDETPTPVGAQRIIYDPRLSFGDGAHPTTRLAAVSLERACRRSPGLGVLDFGSGTGVLSFVALLSGAAFTCGVDIDPVSVEAARQNAALNGLSERAAFGLPGSETPSTFGVVIANLETPTLLALAEAIAQNAAHAVCLIVTGFLADRVPQVGAAFSPRFAIDRDEREDDWALLELKRCTSES